MPGSAPYLQEDISHDATTPLPRRLCARGSSQKREVAMTLVSPQSVARRARIRPVPTRPANTPIVDAKKWLGPHADEMARLYAMILLALPARSRRRRSRIVQVISSQDS